MEDFYGEELRLVVKRAFARLGLRLRRAGPSLSAATLAWMSALSRDAPPDRYFTHPLAFPMLLLPWWLEIAIRGVPNRVFQTDVVYSTVNGYYFVRMIDDLMDREHRAGPNVLPALIFLHTEFQRTYQGHFPPRHAFWDAFSRVSFASAEAASRDAGLERIERRHFLRISSRKVAGAKVPLAAVCHRYERPELLAGWSAFVDLLGCWHQMLNDTRDWARDLDDRRSTYFLSEAGLRKDPAESIAQWVVREGLSWGRDELEAWMEQLLTAARRLGCAPLVAYLERRRTALAEEWAELVPSLSALTRLASVLDTPVNSTPGRGAQQ